MAASCASSRCPRLRCSIRHTSSSLPRWTRAWREGHSEYPPARSSSRCTYPSHTRQETTAAPARPAPPRPGPSRPQDATPYSRHACSRHTPPAGSPDSCGSRGSSCSPPTLSVSASTHAHSCPASSAQPPCASSASCCSCADPCSRPPSASTRYDALNGLPSLRRHRRPTAETESASRTYCSGFNWSSMEVITLVITSP